MLALVTLGVAATVARDSAPDEVASPECRPTPPPVPNGSETLIAGRVEALMRDTELYMDLDLNLARISRRLGLPSRQVSIAINRSHGISVSQYVNEHRVRHASRLLRGTGALAATIWAAIVPALLARASRKRFGSPLFRVWGGKPMIALVLLFGLGNVIVHFLSSFNVLPTYH